MSCSDQPTMLHHTIIRLQVQNREVDKHLHPAKEAKALSSAGAHNHRMQF